MDLIHPHTKADVSDALRECSRASTRVLVVGGRNHIDKGNPCEVDAELWMTQLDRVVSYEPAEMIAVVEAGMRVGDLDALLADGGQEWPADAPADATVGGVIAAAVNSPRRLRTGPIRDSVLEVEVVTGDGRLVRGGGRVVKNVTGYDLPRLATGSLGTLGAIVQVALKLRPRPKMRRTLLFEGDGLQLGSRLLSGVPLPAGILARPGLTELRLEGWPEEVEEQTAAAAAVGSGFEQLDEQPFPSLTPWMDMPIVAEAAVAPSRLPEVALKAGDEWGALLGVGILWAGLLSEEALTRLRTVAGVAPAIKGPGGLGAQAAGAAIDERLRSSFDPAGILAPGRSWTGS